MAIEANAKLARLARGVGSWAGKERMIDPRGGRERTADGTSEVRLGAGGAAVVTDYVQTIDGRVTIDGLAVTIWHPADECYVMYWFDSTGSVPVEMRGNYDGDALVIEGPSPHGGRVRHRSDMPDNDTSRTVTDACFDGETWVRVYEGTLRRVS